jgi:hypothetical protein
MTKKRTASKGIAVIKERHTRDDSRMEKMPVIKNGPVAPGKVGSEKPIVSIPIRPISLPPPERAIQPEQKREVIEALLEAWLRFPYLRLGQLVCLSADPTSAFSVEDSTLKTSLRKFDHTKIRCDSWSHSRTMQCTLEFGHDGDRHFNHLVEMGWNKF